MVARCAAARRRRAATATQSPTPSSGWSLWTRRCSRSHTLRRSTMVARRRYRGTCSVSRSRACATPRATAHLVPLARRSSTAAAAPATTPTGLRRAGTTCWASTSVRAPSQRRASAARATRWRARSPPRLAPPSTCRRRPSTWAPPRRCRRARASWAASRWRSTRRSSTAWTTRRSAPTSTGCAASSGRAAGSSSAASPTPTRTRGSTHAACRRRSCARCSRMSAAGGSPR